MEKHVTNGQLFFIIFLTLAGYSVIELPKTMAESSGTGAWFTIILTALFFMVAVSIIVYLGNMFKEKTLFEYSKLIVGKFITYIFCIIYVLYFWGISSMITRASAEVVKADFLPKTPIWAITFIILIVSWYAASKGISNLGKIFAFYGVIITFMALLIHIIMFISGDFRNTLPLYNVKETGRYFKGTSTAILAFLGYEVLTVVPMSRHNGKKAIYYAAFAILTVAVFYIIIIESCYSIVGIDDIVNYKDALIVAIRRLDIEFLQFFKRLDIMFIIAWLMAIFCTINILIYTLNEYVCKFLSKSNKNIVLIIVSTLVYITSIIPPSLEIASKALAFFAGSLGLVPAFFIPLILLIVAKVKQYAK